MATTKPRLDRRIVRSRNAILSAFERLLLSLDELADSHKVNIVMTSSLPVEDADDTIKRYI